MAEWPADLPAEAGLEYLTAGSILEAGQFVKSANDLSRAILQPDGNFVVYVKDKSGLVPGFTTGTSGVAKLVAQDDNNLVLYGEGSAPLWSTGTGGLGGGSGGFLTLTDDGVLVYSANGEQLWDSVTGVAPPGTVSDILPPPPAVGEAKSGEIPAPALVSEATPVADEAPVEPLEQLAPEEPAAPAVPEAAPVADEAPVEPLEQLAPEEPVAPAVPDLTPAADEAPVEPLEQLAPEEPVAPEVPTAPAVPELAPSLDEPPVEPLEQLAPEPVAPVEPPAPEPAVTEEAPAPEPAVAEVPTEVTTIAEQVVAEEPPVGEVAAMSLETVAPPTDGVRTDGSNVLVTGSVVDQWEDNGTQLYKHEITFKNVGDTPVTWAQLELPMGITWQTWNVGDKEDGARILHLPQEVLDKGGLFPGEEHSFGGVFNTPDLPLAACHVITSQ